MRTGSRRLQILVATSFLVAGAGVAVWATLRWDAVIGTIIFVAACAAFFDLLGKDEE